MKVNKLSLLPILIIKQLHNRLLNSVTTSHFNHYKNTSSSHNNQLFKKRKQ